MREPNWYNRSVWRPGTPTEGNLNGTFHNLDGADGWQDMNCSHALNSVAAGFANYSHWYCADGLISRAGWALVDDSRSPVFNTTTEWLEPQRTGECVAAAARVPCFHPPQLPFNDPAPGTKAHCVAAGCCWDGEAAAVGSHAAGAAGHNVACFQRSGHADWYFFGHGVGGAQYRTALADFRAIAGEVPVPRRHLLGMSWSRWTRGPGGHDVWNGTIADMRAAVDGLAATHFPLDTFVLDMNWHLNQTGWTGYTWDAWLYPNHSTQLLDWLHARGLYVGANLHDAMGVSPLEKRYKAFVAALNASGGNATSGGGQRVPFDVWHKPYAQALHQQLLAPLAAEGIDFWWTDWQQMYAGKYGARPSASGVNPTMLLNHLRFLNPQLMAPTTMAGLRPGAALRGATHSRFGGLGGHRYPTQFGGDVRQTWATLDFLPYHIATAANVLVGWWGEEMMNGQGSRINYQLFTRVMQLGSWSPLFTCYGNYYDPNNLWEAMDFPLPYRHASQLALAQRSMTLPYRYTLAHSARVTGLSSVRSMYYDDAWDEMAYSEVAKRQFMLGPSVLVAPTTTPLSCGDGFYPHHCFNGTASKTLWLPGGASQWLPAFDNAPDLARYQQLPPPPPTQPSSTAAPGVTLLTLNTTLREVPVYVRAGAVLPMLSYHAAISHGSAARALDPLIFAVYGPAARGGAAEVVEDDGMTMDYTEDGVPKGAGAVRVHFQYALKEGPPRTPPSTGGGTRGRTITSGHEEHDTSSSCVHFNISVRGTYHGAPQRRQMAVRIVLPVVAGSDASTRQMYDAADDGRLFVMDGPPTGIRRVKEPCVMRGGAAESVQPMTAADAGCMVSGQVRHSGGGHAGGDHSRIAHSDGGSSAHHGVGHPAAPDPERPRTWAPWPHARTSTGLFYWEPQAPPEPCVIHEEPSIVKPLPTIQLREDLGNILHTEGFTSGVEVGVQQGGFANALLRRWRRCKSYTLVDLWAPQKDYKDGANVDQQAQDHAMGRAIANTEGFRHTKVELCRNFSVVCAKSFEDASLDFVYLDARHDYKGVLHDLNAYWPKLRRGGIMAGHDYIVASEHTNWKGEGGGPDGKGDDYSLNFDGTRDKYRRAVKGAVDEFFTHCVPRQMTVTYRDGNEGRGRFNPVYSTWVVRK